MKKERILSLWFQENKIIQGFVVEYFRRQPFLLEGVPHVFFIFKKLHVYLLS